MTKKKPTIQDVADAAGVSIMTVSRAVRGVEGVSIKTRERILSLAKDLGYQPNYNARSLAVSRSKLIGVSIPTLYDDVFAGVLDGVRSILEPTGFDMIIEISSYDLDSERSWVERMTKWSPAGLIITGVDHTAELKRHIADQAIPTVEIWDTTPAPIDICVGVDHYQAGALAAHHLIDCGKSKACMIGISENRDPRAEKRFSGFSDYFGLQGDVDMFRVDIKPSFEAGYEAISNLLEQSSSRFDCYFFLNDHLAFGGLCALEEAGIDVPREAAIVGFNDMGINAVLRKKITTIATPRWDIGRTAAQKLLARIYGVVVEPVAKIPFQLVEGATTVPDP